jgi:hypothetical protein
MASLAETLAAALDAVMVAADAVIQDALSLASSMHELSHDSTFSFSAASSEPGDASSQPDLLPTANPFGCLPVDPLPDDVVPPSDSHMHTPDPFHVREIRRRRARTKRAHDAAANIRHSHLRAAKEETKLPRHMLEKAVRKKAARFDLSAATASLSTALNATGLVDDPARRLPTLPCWWTLL